jgi:hypothetical protein
MTETQEERIFLNELGITIKPWILLVAKMAALAKGTRLIETRMQCGIENKEDGEPFFIRMGCNDNNDWAWRDYGEAKVGDLWFKVPLSDEAQLFFQRADAIYEKYREAERLLEESRQKAEKERRLFRNKD